MREYHHHEESERLERRQREELERSERRGRGERGERPHHHHEESERSEQRSHGERRERGERGERSHHEELERSGQREESRRHTSWRSPDEDTRDGPRRARVERGMLRYLLLDALRHGPKHGYEMIKWLEEQTYGRYAPSAGIVYPTLQLLEDQGLILAERAEDKSVYRLTETGAADLQSHADFTQEFWERYGQPVPPSSTLLASEFVYEELENLQRTVDTGMRVLRRQADEQRLLSLRQTLERSKNDIRDLLAGGSAQAPMSAGTYDAEVVNVRALEEAIAQVFVSEDDALRHTLVRSSEHGLPEIQISALQGKLLQVLAAACQARKILEIGTLAGYSGIWLARVLPADGRLITLEIDAAHADLARESFREAQVDDRAEVRVGPALEALPHLAAEGPFDLIFIDADKGAYPQYLTWAIQLARPGSIIVADNCIRGGTGLRVQEVDTAQPRDAGIRTYNQHASSHPALCSIALPINTGMTISVVLARAEQEHA
jgi:caffeoyl-CoA O-methyltransferase